MIPMNLPIIRATVSSCSSKLRWEKDDGKHAPHLAMLLRVPLAANAWLPEARPKELIERAFNGDGLFGGGVPVNGFP